MNVNLNETVTLSIETYEQMKEEIKTLRRQVEQKTVYKYVMHPAYAYVLIAIMVIIAFSPILF